MIYNLAVQSNNRGINKLKKLNLTESLLSVEQNFTYLQIYCGRYREFDLSDDLAFKKQILHYRLFD